MDPFVFPVGVLILAVLAGSIFLHFVPVGLWISALAADVNISLFNLVGMRIRRVEPRMIVLPLIKGIKAGLSLNSNQLEAHYLAGGNVDKHRLLCPLNRQQLSILPAEMYWKPCR